MVVGSISYMMAQEMDEEAIQESYAIRTAYQQQEIEERERLEKNARTNIQVQKIVEERIGNIHAIFGVGGYWTFRFYQTGAFESRRWYGYHGLWDTHYMRDFKEETGTYYITKNQYGGVRVYLRYANGKNAIGYLYYKRGTVTFHYGSNTIRHSEL